MKKVDRVVKGNGDGGKVQGGGKKIKGGEQKGKWSNKTRCAGGAGVMKWRRRCTRRSAPIKEVRRTAGRECKGASQGQLTGMDNREWEPTRLGRLQSPNGPRRSGRRHEAGAGKGR